MDKRTAAGMILSLNTSFKTTAAEVFLRSYSSTTIEVKEQKIDAFDTARDIGAGLRVLVGERMGFAFTTDFSSSGLKTLVQAAVTNAQSSEPDRIHALPENHTSFYPSVAIYDPEIVSLSEREKIDRVMAMEREAFAVDPRIKRIRKASATFSNAETLIMNTKGAEVAYTSTACSSSIEAVAEENGESQAGSESDVSRFYRKLKIEEVGRMAAQKALDLLGAKHMDSLKAPVLLDASVAQGFLALLASGFSAESVQKKKSLFMGKLDKAVLSPDITVLDNGLLAGGLGTAPCDDELVPMQTKRIIDRGRLTMFLHNTYTAKKDNTVSTGNGVRGSFRGIPGVSITNLHIEPGTATLAELIQSVQRGLYVTEVMGMHTANTISGDFSVGATGFWIERGEKAYPVREITIAGNILDLMKNVDAAGSDIRFFGRIGCPSLRVPELSIGGT
jgi:PmbA protein